MTSEKLSSSTMKSPEGVFHVKNSNIRIWIHQRNLTKLQQVVWEGFGSKLLVEHSSSSRVRKFLESVPHLMGLIKEIHNCVIKDDLENLKQITKDPMPPFVFSGKDLNGLTPLHKAAGLGRLEIGNYIISKYPESLSIKDSKRRIPLHYAPLAKDNNQMFELLVQSGADQFFWDDREKSPNYYKTKINELDPGLLHVLPESPRIAKLDFFTDWDWDVLSKWQVGKEKRKRRKSDNFKGSNPNVNDNNKNKDVKRESKMTKEKQEDVESQDENTEDYSQTEDSQIEMFDPITMENNSQEEKPKINRNLPTRELQEKMGRSVDVPKVEKKEIETRNSKSFELKENIRRYSPEKTFSKPEKTNRKTPENSMVENKLRKEENSIIENNNFKNQENEVEKRKRTFKESVKKKMEKEATTDSRSLSKNSPPKTQTLSKEINENETRPETATRDSNNYTVSYMKGTEGVIEGMVNGENEIESVNEEGTRNFEFKENVPPEIGKVIKSDNMEQLAALILNGDGKWLVGRKSTNPEIQAFMDNVPIYMSKINRIHSAARNGSLKDLQAALDRRKFAIAKDKISPNGASPLHVAIIFGSTSIVRYLAGRFPETVNNVDDNGRTPLHYAATLDDNGHYYNLLVHLGADKTLKDNFDHTPEYYKKDRDGLSHRSLLVDFGGEELAEEFLKNIGKSDENRIDMPFFWTEEALGDPLIKGLTEIAHKRPQDPIAHLASYLSNYSNFDERNNLSTTKSHNEGTTASAHSPKMERMKTIPDEMDSIKREETSTSQHVDVITIESNSSQSDGIKSAFNSTTRDEHGQSMLHFAAARMHNRNALFQLLQETEINVGYRDELYRTARDISVQAEISENTLEIDRYVLYIACEGDTDKLVELLLEGYDHMIDILDDDENSIIEAVSKKNQPETVSFLQSILAFEEKRERVHYAIRRGNMEEMKEMLLDENDTGSGRLLAIGKNNYGRCSLHIAVLCQQEEIIDYVANTFPETLFIGDNLERTALHYSMGVDKLESISKVLITAGAKRVVKDLKGRQPTYYFMNKSDILKLQEEEETF